MSRQERIDTVVAGTSGSKTATSDRVNAVPGIIVQALADRGSVQPVGFGSFSVGRCAARAGCSSSTGAVIYVPATKTMKFTAGRALREAVSAP
ncbi:DNA-binding protein HU-beta [Paraburkholderia silvatlantica]|uniref:DNA-binding protein HU-beta n=1 Tax=Paraburkholderia silvatlantica TaxID=321895 RepID=A0A2U1A6W1_9BURK|nr:DNA-binding protein HU-beta [Paraburkholderia silvatlantica]PVY27609.1 DNA-binding protein HU-beta [Paraburkholderia silvatlantica]PXW34582.1 DNA-binding protein HU-beta [Paraburkholderia silvatlantica]PYE12716.1 DNA-binding protein HU-beta [Paraburkholderia silvatlantica]TDQ73614.1 DNA-binding protein HU-beta [Paraburkholderia silvatlantica]